MEGSKRADKWWNWDVLSISECKALSDLESHLQVCVLFNDHAFSENCGSINEEMEKNISLDESWKNVYFLPTCVSRHRRPLFVMNLLFSFLQIQKFSILAKYFSWPGSTVPTVWSPHSLPSPCIPRHLECILFFCAWSWLSDCANLCSGSKFSVTSHWKTFFCFLATYFVKVSNCSWTCWWSAFYSSCWLPLCLMATTRRAPLFSVYSGDWIATIF